MKVLIDQVHAGGKQGALARSYADAPEIDGTVKLLPPQKVSLRLKVGEFVKAKIVDTDGHDLIAQPI
jgi:ribosomal protein S12 methylthiotransferase